MSARRHPLRAPCRWCGSTEDGILEVRSGQNSVRCSSCDRHIYNAPKSETGEAPRKSLAELTRDDLDSYTKARIRERDGFRCLMCGLTGADVILHVGHFLSVKDGLQYGLTPEELNDDSNLLTLCEECNLALREHSLPPRLLPTLIRVWRRDGTADSRTPRGGAGVREARLDGLSSPQPK